MQNRYYPTQNSITPTTGKSETIRELAHRHMLNENHTTTDEELKNARIEFDDNFDTSFKDLSDLYNIDNSTVLPPLPFEKNNGTIDDKTSDSNNHEKSFPNSYDILG
jgi:hypothetical protein